MEDVLKKLRNLNGSISGIENFLIFLSKYCSKIPLTAQNINDILEKHVHAFAHANSGFDQLDFQKLEKIQFLIKENFFDLPINNVSQRFIDILLSNEQFKRKEKIPCSNSKRVKQHRTIFLKNINPITRTWDDFKQLRKTINVQKPSNPQVGRCIESAKNLLEELTIETIKVARENNTSNSGIKKIQHAGALAVKTSSRIPDIVSGNITETELNTYVEETKPLSFSEKIWIRVATFAGAAASAVGLGIPAAIAGSLIPFIGTAWGLVSGGTAGALLGGWGTYEKIKNRLSKHGDSISEKQQAFVGAAKLVCKEGKGEIGEKKSEHIQETIDKTGYETLNLTDLIKVAKVFSSAARYLIESEKFSDLLRTLLTQSSAHQNIRLEVGEVLKKHWDVLREANVVPSNWVKLCTLFTLHREIAVNVPMRDRIEYLKEKIGVLRKPGQPISESDKSNFAKEIKKTLPMVIAGCKDAVEGDFKKLVKEIKNIKSILENENIFETVDLISTKDYSLIAYLNDVKNFVEKSKIMRFEEFCKQNKVYSQLHNQHCLGNAETGTHFSPISMPVFN